MIATKQIRKNEKLNSGHNIENTVTYTRLYNIITVNETLYYHNGAEGKCEII